MANVTRELLSTQDRLNDSIIKNNNLSAALEENEILMQKMTVKNGQDLEENLKIIAANEDLLRKFKPTQILLEKVDRDYKERTDDEKNIAKKRDEQKAEELNSIRMETEDIRVYASKN